MESWIDHENVTAVVFAYFPGQESGTAIASVLFGDISPSGKLPFTIGKALEDWPSPTIVTDDVFEPTASFEEGVFIDYKVVPLLPPLRSSVTWSPADCVRYTAFDSGLTPRTAPLASPSALVCRIPPSSTRTPASRLPRPTTLATSS